MNEQNILPKEGDIIFLGEKKENIWQIRNVYTKRYLCICNTDMRVSVHSYLYYYISFDKILY